MQKLLIWNMTGHSMNKPKAVFLDAYTLDPGDNDLNSLYALCELKCYDRTPFDLLIERSRGAEILIINKCPVDAATISALPDLKFILVAATGYNNIDLHAASQRGIPVSNVKGYSTPSVTQHVFAMLLSYLHESGLYYNEVRQKQWSAKDDFSYWHRPIHELAGLKMGIIGFGQIGRAVGKLAHAFGMQLLVADRPSYTDKLSIAQYISIDRVISESDIISLHAPLTDETQHIINRQSLRNMKTDAILINTARGGLIDEKALHDALSNNIIQAALLDVLNQEPPPKDHILLDLQNCYITPHQAWASLQSRKRLLALMVDIIENYKNGKIVNQVN